MVMSFKFIFKIIFFLIIINTPLIAKEINSEKIIERDGLFYEEYVSTPYTGKIIGEYQGFIKNGKLHGEIRRFGINGNILFLGTYYNGFKNGEFIYYDEYNNIKNIENYNNDKKEGIWKEFYSNSILSRQIVYSNNQKQEDSIFWPNGLKSEQKFWKNGKKNSEWISYFENGDIKSKEIWNEGLKVGEWFKYNNKKILISKELYSKNKLLKFEYFFDDGRLENKGEYDNSLKKNGEWIKYQYALDLNGNEKLFKIYHENYKSGILDGYYEKYGELILDSYNEITSLSDGKLLEKGFYKNGLKNGEWLYYTWDLIDNCFYGLSNLDDKIILNYKNGILVGKYQCYYNNNQIKTQGNYLNNKKNGSWIFFEENGYKALEIVFDKGIRTGSHKEFREGKIYTEGQYEKGTMDGLWKYYYPKYTLDSEFGKNYKLDHVKREELYNLGKIRKSSLYYLNGNIEREYYYNNFEEYEEIIFYYENGNIEKKTEYKNGKKNGWSESFEESGFRTYSCKFINDKKIEDCRFHLKILEAIYFETNDDKITLEVTFEAKQDIYNYTCLIYDNKSEIKDYKKFTAEYNYTQHKISFDGYKLEDIKNINVDCFY